MKNKPKPEVLKYLFKQSKKHWLIRLINKIKNFVRG